MGAESNSHHMESDGSESNSVESPVRKKLLGTRALLYQEVSGLNREQLC